MTDNGDTDRTPGYNTRIPDVIMTPEAVETRIGTLDFVDGLPTAATAARAFDHLDFIRGVEVFLNLVPAASVEALRRGLAQVGATAANHAVVFDRLMDSNPLFLTGNTDTVYCVVALDLGRDGPTVLEIPPGCGPGTVNDAFFRFVVDLGMPGPDHGKGGRYLIVPADHEGDVPDGYFVARSPSSVNLVVLRGLLVDGSPDASAALFADGVRVYPLAQADDPPSMKVISGSTIPFNTIHANDVTFYAEVAEVIAREPVGFLDAELRGLAAGIGIRKGVPFAPDERMRAILTDAVAVANATARAIVFKTRDPEGFYYRDGHWQTAFVGGDYRWLIDDGAGGRDLDARTLFFYMATVNTPAMAWKMPGVGSQYAFSSHDSQGNYLDGATSYRLRIPADVPVTQFWSVVVYDPQTRSELQTSQPFPSRNSERDALEQNADGSVDLHFGPTPPAGREHNWIETVPGKGWFTILRLYGPLEPWFDRTWRPGEIERVG